MATIFIFVVLATLVANSVIMRRSKSQGENEPLSSGESAVRRPVAAAATAAAPAVQSSAAQTPVTQASAAQGPVDQAPVAQSRRAVDPRDLEPRRSAETGPGTQVLPVARDDEASTEVFARFDADVSDDEAPTTLLARIPAGGPGY